MLDLRIPFDEAIADERLLQPRFRELSLPQQVLLKGIYGCALTEQEQEIWSAQQGFASYDELGYPKEIQRIPYIPQRYQEAWVIWGRRAGKTDSIGSTIVAYEAALGGHEQYLRPGQEAYCYQIAQDKRFAMYALKFIVATLRSTKALEEMIAEDDRGEKAILADRIRLRNGITIMCLPPTLKATRGYACPVAVLDEVASWYQVAESANPDYEVYRAVRPAMTQFPNKMLLGISSPFNKAGLLHQFYVAGTNGRNARESEKPMYEGVLISHATTAAADVPTVISPQYLATERARDPKAFEREFLAVFQDSLSEIFPFEVLKTVIGTIRGDRPYEKKHTYIAAMDPAFRQDAFAFTIFHPEEDRIVQDVVRRWVPPPGGALNPGTCLNEVATLTSRYDCVGIYTDQYSLEALTQLAFQKGLFLQEVAFTGTSKAEIFGSLEQLIRQGRIELLDFPEQTKELRQLEKQIVGGGGVKIGAPRGAHDDLATVVAVASHRCFHYLPSPEPDLPTNKAKTLNERCKDQLERVRLQRKEAWYL